MHGILEITTVFIQSTFSEVIKAFRAEWEAEQPELYVMDVAFYSETNLEAFGSSIE